MTMMMIKMTMTMTMMASYHSDKMKNIIIKFKNFFKGIIEDRT